MGMGSFGRRLRALWAATFTDDRCLCACHSVHLHSAVCITELLRCFFYSICDEHMSAFTQCIDELLDVCSEASDSSRRARSKLKPAPSATSAEVVAIPAKDLTICRRPDGREWALGAGNFGKVTHSCFSCIPIVCSSLHLQLSRVPRRSRAASVLRPLHWKCESCTRQILSILLLQVYKGVWKRHHLVAIKQLSAFPDDMLLEALQREVAILKRVSANRNVVQFYGCCLEGDTPMLVRPHCRCNNDQSVKCSCGARLSPAIVCATYAQAMHKRILSSAALGNGSMR